MARLLRHSVGVEAQGQALFAFLTLERPRCNEGAELDLQPGSLYLERLALEEMHLSNQPQNITAFDRIAAVLLTQLYETFPSPIQLNASELGSSASPSNSEYEEAFDYCGTASHVVTWLAEEGFIRHGNMYYGGTFVGVRLTMKGLSVLDQIPSTIKLGDPSESIATKLKRVVSKGAEGAASESIKSILTQVFDLALRYGNTIPNSGVLTA